MKFFNKIINEKYNKILKKIIQTNWFKICLLLVFLLIFLNIFKENKKNKENFSQKKEFILKDGDELYDEFYSELYDELILDKIKNKFELKSILNKTEINENSKLLDVGSGTGEMVHLFNKNNVKSEGLDKSLSMINISKKKYENYKFTQGDVLNSMLYQPNIFTHITCLYFTIYYIKNKKIFFENTFKWLEKDGYLIIHLVDRNLFDPILDKANPITAVSVQKYADKRITTSIIKFGDFLYKAKFKLNEDNTATFTETMKHDYSGSIRKNIHRLFMEKKEDIIELAKNSGFKLKEEVSLVHIGYEYQYLYIFQK